MEYIHKTIVKVALIMLLIVIGENAIAAIIYTDVNPNVVSEISQTYNID